MGILEEIKNQGSISMNESLIKKEYELLKEKLNYIDIDSVKEKVKSFQVEVPSWVFGYSAGGRFGEFAQPGYARDIKEKIADAAFVNKITDACKKTATHILWDMTKDGETADMGAAEEVFNLAKENGIELGAINPTYFLKGSHRNSLGADEEATRKRYIEQTISAGEIADKYANGIVSVWIPDGSMYPGQIDLKRSLENLIDSMKKIRNGISDSVRILTEYKIFEPGTYSTTIVDWGTAALISREMGGNSGILIDMGHHFPHANIEQIVAYASAFDLPAGFHFNTRYAADDDHSVEPNPEFARIFYELAKNGAIFNKDESKNWAYTIDQVAGRENRIHAIVHTIDSLMISAAKGLIVNQNALDKAQNEDDVIVANRIFNDALLLTDVRPIVNMARVEKGLNPDPIAETSSYIERIVKERS